MSFLFIFFMHLATLFQFLVTVLSGDSHVTVSKNELFLNDLFAMRKKPIWRLPSWVVFSLQLNHLLKLNKNFFEISTLWQVKSVCKQKKRNKTLFFIHWPPLGHYLSKSHFYDGSSKTTQEKINWNKKFFSFKAKMFFFKIHRWCFRQKL